MRAARARGFTLVELVMVIVLTGALFATTSIFIIGPTRAYADLVRRAQLVDSADIALRRMARDIRSAIPNSIRVHSSGLAIEMLDATSGARYRAGVDATKPASDPLRFDAPDDSFDLLGGFPGIPTPFTATTERLVLFNLGTSATSGSDAYEAGSRVISPSGFSIGTDNVVVFATPFQFAYESPEQRIYLTRGVTRYTCAPDAGTPADGNLTRLTGAATTAAVPYVAGSGDLVTEFVQDCAFNYIAGSASRSAVVTMTLTLNNEGERITLLRQVQVENLP